MKDAPPFPVIDAHVHLYPESLAPKVVPALAARFGNAPAFDGTIGQCSAANDACGIVLALNLPVATRAEHVSHTNAFWAAYAKPDPSRAARVLSLAALHPAVPDAAAEVGRIAEQGFRGIKFHPEYQQFRFNDAHMDDVWAAMAEKGLVAYLHAGGERVFNPPYHSTPGEIARLHARFPRLRIVAAHLGGFGMWDETEQTLLGKDVALDLSHTFFWMDHARIARMIKRHGPERILFGTDAPWQQPQKVLEAFLSLRLDEKACRSICYDNACAWFRLV